MASSHPRIRVRDLLPPAAPNAFHVAWLVVYVLVTLALTYDAYVGAAMNAWALCLIGYVPFVGTGWFVNYDVTGNPDGGGDV